MNNEIYGFKPLKETIMLQCEAATSTSSSGQLVSRLQIGDRIEGVLVQEENNIVLKLDNGMKLSINLLDYVELGKLFSFSVVGKEGNRLILKPHLVEVPSNKQFVDKVIDELKLPNQTVMKSIIGQFIAKGLSLDKESLLGVFQCYKTYDVPTEILVNLKSNNTPIELKDLNQFAKLNSEGIKVILEEFEAIIVGIKDSTLLEKLVHDLGNTISVENLESTIKETLLNGEGIVESIEPHMRHIIEGTLKEWFLSNYTENHLELKINNATNTEPEIPYVKVLRALLEAILKDRLEVNITQIKEDIKESEKIIGTSKQLEEIIKQFQKLDLPNEGKEKLQQINQIFQVLEKYNVEAEYFYFPFTLNKQQGDGELYFFKPKKKQGIPNERMYIVMALNMPSLRKVEVHIEQIQNAINMTLKVEDQTMKKLIEDVLGKLHEELKSSGYELNQLSVALLKASGIEEKIDTQLHHMDLKI